jgi:hypothetical protein
MIIILVIAYLYLALWVYVINRMVNNMAEIFREMVDLQHTDIQNMNQVRLALSEINKVDNAALRNKFLTTFYGGDL